MLGTGTANAKKNYETIIELQRSNIRKLKYDIFES